MKEFISMFQNIMLYVVRIKRTVMAVVSLPTVLSDLTGFIGRFFNKFTNYFDLLAETLAIKYRKFRAKNPLYAKVADRVEVVLGVCYDFLVSPRAWRSILIVLSVIGFGLSTMGMVPLVVFGLTMLGIIATAHSEAKQKVNILKLQREERALRMLVKQKQRALGVAETLGIKNADLAKQLGFKSFAHRAREFKPLPKDNAELKSIPASLLHLADLKKAQLDAKSGQDTERYKILTAKIKEAKQIAQQKNELGYTTVSKAGMKAASSGFIGAVTSLGVLSYMTSPYTLALGISSVLGNYVGSGVTGYTDSNLKQGLKNAVLVYRTRPDIPEYHTLAEIEHKAREAKLERKVIEALARNHDYCELIKPGMKMSDDQIAEARAIKLATEQVILKKSQASLESKELKKLDKLIEGKVKYLKYIKAKELYSDRSDESEYKNIELKATKLVIKIRLIKELLVQKCDKGLILQVMRRVDEIKTPQILQNPEEIYKNIEPAMIRKLIEGTLRSPHTKQQIELKTLEMINLSAQIKARETVMNEFYRQGTTYQKAREQVIEKAANEVKREVREQYLNREKMSRSQMYFKALRSIFDFTSPNIVVGTNPHDILFDTSINEFAVFSDEKKVLKGQKEEYQQRVTEVQNIIDAAINLDSTMRSVVPILTILAVDPSHIVNADNKIEQLFHTLISPQSSPYGSQVVSDDHLPATINNPSDNSGIVNVTFYLLFARIGQFFGALLSYGVNSYRDWREGKKLPLVQVDNNKNELSNISELSSAEAVEAIKTSPKKQQVLRQKRWECRVGRLSRGE